MPKGDGDSQGLSSMGKHTQSPTLNDITSQKPIITTLCPSFTAADSDGRISRT